MHQIRRCILLHFGYTPGVTLFLYMLPPMKSFIVMTQSRLTNGVTRASRYRNKPSIMNDQSPAVAKNVPISAKSTTLRKSRNAGEYRIIANRICRVVKVPMERTSAAASSRRAPFLSDVKGAGEGLAACRSARGRAAIFRAVLQSVSSARTGTNHPAACNRCAKRAIAIEWAPTSVNPSSGPSGVSSTARQIAITSSHSGLPSALASGLLNSASPA